MPFGGLKLTNFGMNLILKTQQGKKLKLSRVAIGDGVPDSASIYTLTALVSERKSFPISDVRTEQNSSAIIFRLHNEDVTQGFYYREIAVFALDPDTGTEGVYLYDSCRDDGEYIHDNTDPKLRVNMFLRLHILFASTEQIEFVPGGDPIYVLYDEYLQHIAAYQSLVDSLPNRVIDGGGFEVTLAEHSDNFYAHQNLIVDANEDGGEQIDGTAIERHNTDPVAHTNVILDGQEF